MRQVHIVLYGHFGSGNIGNDSSLEAALYNMRALLPLARFTCVCNGPEVVGRRFGIQAVAIDDSDAMAVKHTVRSKWAKLKWLPAWAIGEWRSWTARVRWLRTVDLFVVVGTGAVDDMAVPTPWESPFALYKWCKCAKLGGAKVAFLSVGVGPIVHPVSRALMLRALRLADFRSYRETSAVDYLHKCGFDTQGDSVRPDLVFSLAPRRVTLRTDASTRMTVGLGLINYFGWRHDVEAGEETFRRYMSHMKRFASYLLEHGHRIRILIGDATDRNAVDEMIAHLGETHPAATDVSFVAEAIDSVDDLLEQVAEVQVVVASRFHNVLTALMAGRPVVSIGYHAKNRLLMSSAGLGDFCQDIDSLDHSRLIEQFTACWERREQLSQLIRRQLDGYRVQLDDQYRSLLAGVGGDR